ncbi:methyltransferase domain-containing protein [Aegicerativicinus sediminis]|uniref:methyltransferase domain-containing protein n=1 Tax=Aegicerativicinus sediminis TaxID=2893202 RepID=UPI001E46ADAA|nr:methyltransferase domain-containing protein [Aegicerativicinus sediminis]
MYENTYPTKRFKLTLEFLKEHIDRTNHILDLGVTNPLSEVMISEGYKITNTSGIDLDEDTHEVETEDYQVVTAFEIFEHLVAPYNVLKAIKAKKLVCSVPLKLWFSNAYKNENDPRDRHYHEFEDWQFDWLLEKAGWTIIDKKKWTHPTNKIGLRPILRYFYPRYYIVYAERQ